MTSEANMMDDYGPGTVAVRLSHRVFPQQAGMQEATLLRQTNRGGTIADLKRELTERLIGRLSWDLPVSSAMDGKERLVSGYISCLNQVERFRTEFEQLVKAICVTGLEFRQAATTTETDPRSTEGIRNAIRSAESAQLDELLERAGGPLMPARNIVTAEWITKPLDVMSSDVDHALRRAVTNFADQVFETFERLVDEQIAGLVEWFDGNVCRYHFFKSVVIHRVDVRNDAPDSTESRNGAFDDLDDRTSSRRSRPQSQVRHEHRLARHEHHAINAFCTSIENSRVVVPENVQRMMKQIPDWLRPSVQVVDGTLVRELIVESHVRTEVTDIPVYGCEPAVIIGPFVLSGWGPREIDQELRRVAQTEAPSTESQHQQESAPWIGLAGVTVVSVLCAAGMAHWVHPAFALLGVVLVVFAVWCGMKANAVSPGSPSTRP